MTAMGKSNRTKLLDRTYNTRDAQLFIIATEGAKTEKPYFQIFQDSRIKVEIIPTGEDNKSAPQYVIQKLNEFSQQYDFGENDTLWLVLDVDHWATGRHIKNLNEVCREAKNKKYGLAISNPCFETWLCLHLDDLDPNDKTCDDFEKRLRLILGSYNKSNLDTAPYVEHIEDAIRRAKQLHPNGKQNWPATPGSHVYRVVEMILKAMRKS